MGDGESKKSVNSSWSLIEEVNLLKAMVVCGQDWQGVSKQCKDRSPDECKSHYYEHFIDNPKLSEFRFLLQKSRQNFHQFSRSFCEGLLPDSCCKCDNLLSTSSESTSKTENSSESGLIFDWNRYDSNVKIEIANAPLFEDFNCCDIGSFSSSTSCKSSTFNLNAVDLDNVSIHCDNRLEIEELEDIFGLNLNNCKTKNELKLCDSSSGQVLESPDFQTHDLKKEICESNDLKPNSSVCDDSDSKFISPSKIIPISKRKIVKRHLPDSSLTYSKRKVLQSAQSSTNSEQIGTFGVSFPQDLANKNSNFYREIAGFDANRTEFEIEYDNGAEEIFNSFRYELLLKMPDDDVDESLVTELSLAMVKGYIHRLKERQKRKEIVHRFGLLNCFKATSFLKTVEVTFGKQFAKRLVRLKRLFSSQDYDSFLKGYQRFNQLKFDLSKLCNYRELGITTLAAVNLHEELSKIRNENNKQLQGIPLVKRLESGESVLGNHFRRPAPPIAVTEMPGCEALDKEEVEFCSLQRLVPKSYLEYKKILISECERRQGLKLAQARPLLKIDVNKTRKLYDLLLNKKLIWKEETLTD